MFMVGKRIAERIEALKPDGMSQVKLAKLVDMRQQGINSIIAGKVERPRKLREIAAELKTTQEYLLGETDDPSPAAQPVRSEATVIAVPLFGNRVSAGRLVSPGDAPPSPDGFLMLSDLGRGDFIALPVKGDSMDRISPENSLIVVNRNERALQRGKPYVFAIRGELTYKLWEPSPPRLEPFSWNPANKPIYIDKKNKLHIVGRVRRTILDL